MPILRSKSPIENKNPCDYLAGNKGRNIYVTCGGPEVEVLNIGISNAAFVMNCVKGKVFNSIFKYFKTLPWSQKLQKLQRFNNLQAQQLA